MSMYWNLSKNNNLYRTFQIDNITYILCDGLPKKNLNNKTEKYITFEQFYHKFPQYYKLLKHRCGCCDLCDWIPSPRCDGCTLVQNNPSLTIKDVMGWNSIVINNEAEYENCTNTHCKGWDSKKEALCRKSTTKCYFYCRECIPFEWPMDTPPLP